MSKLGQLLYESEESLIYLEEDKTQGKRIRKVLRSTSPHPDLILQFNNEFDFTRELEIEGVRMAISKEKLGQQFSILLEYVDGSTLEEAFVGKKNNLEEILKLFIHLADTIGKFHQKGIIHKDLNGKNILWNAKTKTPIIIDFGISNRLDLISNNLGNPDKVKGTLTHMSPEQTGRVNRVIDSRSDLYSLGVTFFQVLTGSVPFASDDSLELVHFHIAKSVPHVHRLNPEIPEMISAIVSKLMAKNAEDRYQTAFGLKHDLEKCLAQLQQWKRIDEFVLGEKDFSGKFQIHQKLYGRYEEIKTLMKSFDRVSKGSTELFLVAGYSGVGKSALIYELYKPITELKGYFISGKFDQYQRNIPYYAVVQAFSSFVDLLLTEKEESLKRWRKIIQNAIGENGQVLLDLIPSFEKIIGEQPAVAKLEAMESQNRFNTVFQKFIKAICRAEHPLVLFVDDLQWADVGSLNLIRLLTTSFDNPYLLIMGAYRDNEVAAGHPLLTMIENATKEKAQINSISLKPLSEENVFEMIKEALNIEDKMVRDLTELVYSKTLGNAFFTIEFLKSLNQNGLVKFSFEEQKWNVNLDGIKKKGITNNVVDLLVGKINELPETTQRVLQLASCIGNIFDLQLLSVVYGKNMKSTFTDLWKAVEEGMLQPTDDSYQYIDIIEGSDVFKVEIEFQHDRVQQAAYSMLSDEEREKIHLQIGKYFQSKKKELSEIIFDIVNHINEGIRLITDKKEIQQMAELNLQAAFRRAIQVHISRHIVIFLWRKSWQEKKHGKTSMIFH